MSFFREFHSEIKTLVIVAGFVVLVLVVGAILLLRETPPAPVEELTLPEEEIETQALDTSTWKTCTNSTYGFSIAYPTNFDVDPITCNYSVMEYNRVKDISVVNPIDDFRKNWLLTITAHKTLLNANQWIKSQCPIGHLWIRCSEPMPGPIPTSMQYDLLNVHYAGRNTIVKINSTLFDFSLNARNPNTPVSHHIQQVYDQILSTFRFVE